MQRRYKMWLAAAVTILFWGTAFPVSKYVVQYIPAVYFAELRIVIGAVLLGGGLVIKKEAWPTWKDWPWFVAGGLAGQLGYQLFFNLGLLTIPAATSSIIVATTPLLTAILAQYFYGERLSLTGWMYICTAFAGVAVLLLWKGIFALHIGALWTGCAAICFAGYNLISRKLSAKGYSAWTVAAATMLGAAVVGAPVVGEAFSLLGSTSLLVQGGVLYLAVFPGSLAYVTWSLAITLAEKTSEVTTFMFFSPAVATIAGFILLREVPHMGLLVGGSIIIGSVYLFNKYR